jgi:hypothetical protein
MRKGRRMVRAVVEGGVRVVARGGVERGSRKAVAAESLVPAIDLHLSVWEVVDTGRPQHFQKGGE